jgi:hypothetical protein
VQAAVEQYLDSGELDGALILRRLDRQAQTGARVQRDLEVLSEAVSVFFRIWALYLPKYSDDEIREATPRAAGLFDEYIGLISRQLAGGSRLTAKVLKEGTSGPESSHPKSQTPPASAGR